MDQLIKKMNSRACRSLKAYKSDLVLDFDFLSSKWDQERPLLWLVRPTGTHLGYLDDLTDPDSWITAAVNNIDADIIYIIAPNQSIKKIALSDLKREVAAC